MTQTGTHTANAYGVNNVYAVGIDPDPPDAGWLIYAKDDGIGGIQIWMIVPDGTTTQLGGPNSGGLPTGLTYVSPDFSVGTDTDNQVVVSGSATGDPVTISAVGSDPQISLGLVLNDGNAGLVVTSRPAFIQAMVDDIVAIGNRPGLIVNGHDQAIYQYAYNNETNEIYSQVTGGLPGAGGAFTVGNEVMHWDFYVDTGGGGGNIQQLGFLRAIYAKGGMANDKSGLTWDFSVMDATDVNLSAPFLQFDANNASTIVGRDIAGDSTVIGGASDAGTTVASGGGLTVTTRTGSAATFACFTVDGTLVESAVACA